MSSYLYFNYCINVNFLGSSLGYKKLLFPRRVLLTCLTAILLSTKDTLWQPVNPADCFILYLLTLSARLATGTPLPPPHRCISGGLGTWLRWLCQSCVSSPGSEPKAPAVSIPWAPEQLHAGVLPVAVCRPMAGVTQWDGSSAQLTGTTGPACWQRKQPMHECVREANRTKKESMFLTDVIFFFQRDKTQTSQANPRNFFKMLQIPTWILILILLRLGMRQTMWLYIGLNKLV